MTGPPISRVFTHPRLIKEGIIAEFQLRPVRTWFFFSLLRQHYAHFGPWGSYYEFGTGTGTVLSWFVEALKSYAALADVPLSDYRILGFDSFTGLPKKESPRDDNPDWYEGQFAKPTAEIDSLLQGIPHRLIEGFYEKSLTFGLRDELRLSPPSIVTIDVDYYSSAKTVLEWLRPILPTGCLFYFDDVWSFYGNPKMGELAAIKEFNEQGDGLLLKYDDWLTSWNRWYPNLHGRTYVYCRKEWEYTK